MKEIKHWVPAKLLGLVFFSIGIQYSHSRASEFQPMPLDQSVYYGAAPSTEADFEQLRQLGITRIIDLRSFKARSMTEEKALACRFGIQYQRIEIGFTPRFPDQNVESVLRQLRCLPSAGGVYVHCTLGRDRTGLIVALYRQRYLGWLPQTAYCEKKAGEFNGLLIHLDRYFWDSVG